MNTPSRRTMLQTGIAGAIAALAATPAEAQSGCVDIAPGEQFQSVITNATSGVYILKNAEQDYSVKMVSGDGTKNVTVVRYAGMTAWADASLVHGHLRSLLLILRLDV